MKYLIFAAARHGWIIKNDETGDRMYYIGYTARQAEKAFRRDFNLQNKHFKKIFI